MESGLRIEGLEPALKPGDVLALLGEGTALLRGLAGLSALAPPAWLGEAPLAGPPHRRGLGVVLDPPGLFPNLSVAENIGWPLRVDVVEREARVREVLAQLDLQPLGQRQAGGLAPGEARLVALARALALRPPVLLLENPFAGLEPTAREALALQLRRLGPAVVLASDDAASALAAADRVAVLQRGRVLQQGTPRELYARPESAEVARLTGEANFLPGRIAEVFDDECRVTLAGGAVVEGMLAAPLEPGAACQVMLRPERLAVAAATAEAMGEGALGATLAKAVFQGREVRLSLSLAEGGLLLARRPAGLRLPAPGEACAVAWETAAALVFAA